MKTHTQTILFVLTAILLFASMIQQATGVFSFKELNGVTQEQSKPVLSFQNLRNETYQSEAEVYLKQHYGFREPLTRLYNQNLWTFFHYSKVVEDQRIVITNDNWIFEPPTIEEYYQSLAYNYAKDSMEMAETFEVEAKRLYQIQQILEPYGTRLFVALLPGKEQICEEHIPKNTRYLKEKKITAFEYYSKRLKELGVNQVNFGEWFIQMKGHTDYPLFPQTGAHWSILAAIHSADSLVRYMEWLSDSNMINIKTGDIFKRTMKPDVDVESLMNLIWPLQKMPNYLAEARYDDDTTAWHPRLLTIGDSFYWNIINFTPVWTIFTEIPYWYYFSSAFYNEPGTSVNKKDVLKEVLLSDFVMLSYSTVSLYQMSNGFSKRLLHEIYYDEGETGPIDFDSIPTKRSKKFIRYTKQKDNDNRAEESQP